MKEQPLQEEQVVLEPFLQEGRVQDHHLAVHDLQAEVDHLLAVQKQLEDANQL
jgi:hypothetical protein